MQTLHLQAYFEIINKLKSCVETTAEMKTLLRISNFCASCLNIIVFKCIITRVSVIKIVLEITKQKMFVRVCVYRAV